MEFFDMEKLVTYSSLLPTSNKEDAFLIDDDLFLWAQGKIYSKNMAEKSDLKTGEVLNSILSSLQINIKDKTFKYAIRKEALEIRKQWLVWKRRCTLYRGCRLTTENYQKLKDVQTIMKELVPKISTPSELGIISILPSRVNPPEELSITINTILSMFKVETSIEEGVEEE